MKKTVLIFFAMLCMTSTFAGTNTVSGSHTVFDSDIGFDSVGVYSDVTVSYSNFYTYLIFKANGDSVWKSGPSTFWLGSGLLYNSIHNLSASTTDSFKLVFWKIGQPNDTLLSPFTVTTKPAPPAPIFSVVAIPGLDTSILEISVTNANGYYPAISARYGPGLASKTDTVRNKTGNFIARLKLYTPIPNTPINYRIKYDVDSSVPVRDTFYSGSFTTPSITYGKITGTSIDNVGTDSIRVSVSIAKGNYDGVLTLLIKDSASTNYITSQTKTVPIVASGTYSNTFRPLSSSKPYQVVFAYWDQAGVDTARRNANTVDLPKLAAPSIEVLPPGSVSHCGTVTFTGVRFTPTAGDTSKTVITRSNDNGITFPDTVWTRNNITSIYSTGSLVLSAPMSSHHYYWAVDGYSKDNLKNRVILDASTPTGDSPNVLASFVGMNTTSPSISFGGYGGCDATIAYVYVLNSFGDTIFRVIIDIGPFQYSKTLALPNLPDDTYHLIVRVINQNGSGLDEDVQTRYLMTGIVDHMTQKLIYDPYLNVTIYGEVGQKLGSGIWRDISDWLMIPTQIKIITIYAEKDGKQYSVKKFWPNQQ